MAILPQRFEVIVFSLLFLEEGKSLPPWSEVGIFNCFEEVMHRTPLYDWHVAQGAKMVEFAGWEMPLFYTGIVKEHLATRGQAGLFDLGHMSRIKISGPDRFKLVQLVATNDIELLSITQFNMT